MTVLFVALGIYSREGGIERFNRRVLGCLGARGNGRAIVLWDPEGAAAAAPRGIAFEGCGESKVRALVAFVRALRHERPDVVLYGHSLLAPLALVARVFGRRARNVLIAHGYEVWDRPGPLRRRVVGTSIDYVASVSDFTASSMARAYGMEAERFVRVLNAIEAEPAPERRPAVEGERRLLCVSRLNPLDKAKHVDKVIEAMPLVLDKVPDARLYVVGDGEWRPELERLVAGSGLDGAVHLLGAVPDERREELYATSEVFVLPSTQEGFGIVYLEAWRHRLAVIAGAGGAAPEVVRDGLEGLVVEPSPDAIAAAILRLLGDPALARRLGEAGHRRLSECFTPAHFDAAFDAMLERVSA